MKPKSRKLLLASSALLSITYVQAASATWNVNSDGLWSLDGNWNPGAAPGATSGTTSADIATFGTVISTARTITVDANRNIFGIDFAGNSFGYTLSGGNLLLTNGGYIQTSGAGSNHTDTINSAIEIQGDGGSAAFTAGSSNNGRLLVIGGNVNGVSTGVNVTTLNLNGANTGANSVNGNITDGVGGGKLEIVKSGAGIWNIGGTNNNFTGDVTLGGGTLNFITNPGALANGKNFVFTGNSTLSIANAVAGAGAGYIGGSLTVNSGVTATLSPSTGNNQTFASGTSGSNTSTLAWTNGSGSSTLTVNDLSGFTGNLRVGSGSSSSPTFKIGNITDAAGYGNLQFAGSLNGAATFELFNSTGPVTFNNRSIEILSGSLTATPTLTNNQASAANNWVINTDLINSATGAKTFTLGGSNTGANTFGGNIANGSGTVTVAKTGAGTWHISGDMSNTGGLTVNAGGALTLSGTNTYSGNTNFTGVNAQLVLAGSQAASANTIFVMNTNASSASSNIKFLDDTGNVNGGTATFAGTYRLQSNNTAGVTNTFIVGNNNTANGGTSSGTTTGSTIAIGTLNWNTVANNTTQVGNINIQGTNGYRLQINNVVMFNGAGHTAGATRNTNFNPTTANVTLGTVTMAAGNAVNGIIPFLVLGGTSSDNRITGAISDASDVGTSLRPVNVTKSSSSTWTLGGTNTYTGATSVTGGLLRFTGNSSAATGAVTVSGGALGGNGGSLGGAVTVSSTGGIKLADGSVGSLTLGSTLGITGAADANNLTFDLGNTTGTSDSIVVAGTTSVTTTGAAVINLSQLGGSAGRTATTYTLIGGAGTLAGADFAKFSLATTAAFGQTYSLTNTGDDIQLVATNVTGAVAANTTHNVASGSWQASGSFTGAAVSDYQSNVIINSAVGTTPLNGSTNINSLTFGTSATTAVTISPGTASAQTNASMLVIEAGAANGNTAGNGITLSNTSGTHIISSKIGLASSQTWSIAGTTGGLSVSGAITDFGAGYALTKDDGGTLTLTGANTYSGGNTINGGILSVGTSAAAAVANGPLTLSNGAQLTGAATNISGAFTVSVNAGGGFMQFSKNNSLTTSEKLTGAGSLTLKSAGGSGFLPTFNFNSLENDFTGALVLQANTVNANSLGDALGSGNIIFNQTDANGNTFNYGSAATALLTLDNRAIEINAASAHTATLQNNNTSQAISIGTNLVATGAGSKTLALGAVAGPSNVFSGPITDGDDGGAIAVSKTGVGNWSLNGTSNTFGGDITLSSTTTSAGTLAYASAGGANAIKFLQTTSSATLTYTGSGQTMSGAITASALTSGTITLDASGAGAIDYSNGGSLGSATSNTVRNLILSGTNTGDNILAGQWVNNTGTTNAATLTKNGAGKWALSGNNTYTGATNIIAGTLLINGISTSTGQVTVASGATLGGTGSTDGSVSLQSRGTLSPGASIESLKTGAVTMASGSAFAYEVSNNTATGADLLAVNGKLTLSNVTLSLDSASLLALAGGSWTAGDILTLISYTGAGITSGFVGYTDDTNYNFGSNVWTFNYDDTAAGNNFVSDLTGSNRVTLTAFTVVPEPSALLLGGLGALLLLRRRR
jgi:fibronectin-binding autotransporter adhesin